MQCPAYKLERNALFNMANLNIEMINMNNEEKFITVLVHNLNGCWYRFAAAGAEKALSP